MKALEELFVETSLALPLISPHLVSENANRTLVHPENQVQPYHGGTSSACTEDHHCQLSQTFFQLGISYQTLQDIHYASSTDADFGKALAGRSAKPTSQRETCGLNSNLRSRASALMPHILMYLYFCYQPAF